MDCPGRFPDTYYIPDYFSHLFILYFIRVRNWLSVFFLYEKVCDPASHFIVDYSYVLLPAKNRAGPEERIKPISE